MDALSILWRDLGRLPSPDPAEQDELARAIEESVGPDRDKAIARIVERNMALVVHTVKRYSRYAEMDDLVQEGAIGLQRAAVKFRRGMGIAFGTYATYWIRQAAQRYLATRARLIRLPTNKSQSLTSGGTPAWDGYRGGDILSLDWTTDTGDAAGSRVPCRHTESLEAEEEAAEARHRVTALVAGLKPKLADVIVRLWGLDGRPRRSLREAGADLGVDSEWVRQLGQRALRDMQRTALAAETKEGL